MRRRNPTTWAKCGHERTRTNTARLGTAFETCRTCKMQRDRDWRQANKPWRNRNIPRNAPTSSRPTVEQPPSSFATLYREERQRHAERRKADPAMTAARDAFAALLEREKLAGRGGRPKGSRPVNPVNVGRPGKPRLYLAKDPIPDLTSQLGPFFGSQG